MASLPPVKRLLVAVVLSVLASSCGQPATTEPVVVPYGEPGVDGQFTFEVSGFECGIGTAGEGIITTEARGTFCFLDLVVTNTGQEGRRFFSAAQRLLDDQERKLEPSVEATLLVNADEMNEELNPGLSLEVTVVFDVDETSVIDRAMLHDSPLSGGVTVALVP